MTLSDLVLHQFISQYAPDGANVDNTQIEQIDGKTFINFWELEYTMRTHSPRVYSVEMVEEGKFEFTEE